MQENLQNALPNSVYERLFGNTKSLRCNNLIVSTTNGLANALCGAAKR
jgi:hypothetical protein